MKICFVGLGSIAARHIRGIKELFGASARIDVLRSGNGKMPEQRIAAMIHKTYYSLETLPRDYDVIFITNPTALHYCTLEKMHNRGRNFFIEKPVFQTGKEDLGGLRLQKDRVYYVACPLRYTNVIQYLKQTTDFSEIYSVRSISSSYLPDWRPEVDYRKTYSADASLGGGVSIDLIHEWDYLCYLLGEPEKVYSIIGKKSALEVHSDDIAVYIAEYRDKVAELHLDYFGRFPIRRLQLFGKSETLEADLLGESISFTKEGKVLYLKEGRDAYQKKELQHFFAIVQGKAENDSTLQNACRVLRIARGEMGE